MSKYSAHAHIAGEIVASGKRTANEVADRIIERLAADGYHIVAGEGVAPSTERPITIRIGDMVIKGVTRIADEVAPA